ncbi:MAG TPA: hypothetical protein VGM44_07405 [Polyangiaceae bacterium]
MAQRCEVCEQFRPSGDLLPGRELVGVQLGKRDVLLCRAHAGIAKNSGVSSVEDLRELFAESSGRRSYVSRRGDASAGAKARMPGRRATDDAP